MTRRSMVLAVLALTFLAIPASAQLYTYDWSMVGSAGTVDPTSSPYAYAGPGLKFVTGGTGTILARYPVTNTYGSFESTTPPWQYFILSYALNSSLGGISARLMRVDHCSADEEQMCIINITSKGGGCARCLFNPGELDFANNSYYAEVTLTSTNSAATPQVNTVAIGN